MSATDLFRTRKYVCLVIFWAIPFWGVAQTDKIKEMEVQADTLLQRENFKEAIKLYNKVIELSGLKESSDYNALYKRAIAFMQLQQFPSALADLEKVIDKNPQAARPLMMRAMIYREMNELEKQLQDVEKAIELTGDPGLMKWRATLYLQKDLYAEAKRDLLYVRTLQPDPETEAQLAYAYYSLQETDSAMQCINKAIEIEPSYLPAYYYAGSFCLEQSQYELGLKYINLGLRLEPANASLLLYKGVTLIELKKEDEGCRFLRKALEAGEENAADYLLEYCYKNN